MGTYVWYSGAADYPLEKRKRIKENILKIKRTNHRRRDSSLHREDGRG